ncbi:glutathione S-transferase family protein [Desulforhopalus sp. 52FAK]
MLKFYFHPTPNPMKVALFLEEAELAYELIPIDTKKGEQHSPEFRQINPNGKLPAISDNGENVFDSTAILMYLSEKTGKFAGKKEDRGQILSWLMFIGTGLGPYSGQAVHFQHAAPEKIPYAINRYVFEAKRHYQILEDHITGKDFFVGNNYSIVDISAWGWVKFAQFVLGPDTLASDYPNLSRWFSSIDSRPAAERARNVGANIDFKTEDDEESRKALFPQNQ